ncbi:methytransferase partner Trm112 [Methanolapillus africanus]|uniref:methytransferase partner Trm112 n=1 Tax=Methanolapillus africanus TaxID=3028297 RepID=UPI0030B8B214
MKKSNLSLFVCPLCRGELTAKPEKENANGTEIVSGNLYCPACSIYYPIENKIPNLLPPDMRDF